MGIAFGLFVAVILVIALLNRRKQNKTWVKEERHDESGAWVDKRAGERGTYGSLDAEMEQERRNRMQQGRINELARIIRDYAFEHYPGFHSLSDAQIKEYNVFVKNQVAGLQIVIGKLPGGLTPDLDDPLPSETPHTEAIKKLILDFSFEPYPALLDLEIETIKQFDRYAGKVANALTGKIEEFKT